MSKLHVLLLLLLLLGAFALLARANTTDVQLGVLGPTSVSELLTFLQADREMAERRHEEGELRHKSLLQSIDQIADAVVKGTTSERVYACAKAATVLLQSPSVLCHYLL